MKFNRFQKNELIVEEFRSIGTLSRSWFDSCSSHGQEDPQSFKINFLFVKLQHFLKHPII